MVVALRSFTEASGLETNVEFRSGERTSDNLVRRLTLKNDPLFWTCPKCTAAPMQQCKPNGTHGARIRLALYFQHNPMGEFDEAFGFATNDRVYVGD